MKLGFLGLGAMGAPMAGNLIEAGHELTVWNRTPERAEPFARAGARRARTPAEAAGGAEAVILMLADADAVREVLFGENGVVETLPESAAVIDMSTIGVEDSLENAEVLRALGHPMLDAPVTGSVPVAEAGELTILVGGEESLLEKHREVLEVMGRRIFHLGPTGSGSRMKLVNNLIAASNLAALAEGLALGEAAGIPAGQQLEVLMSGAAASKMCEIKGANMAERSYDPKFKLSHMVKDLNYALELGRDLAHALPVTGLVTQVFTAGLKDRGEEDISAVFEVSRRG